MKYLMSENAQAIVKETAAAARLITRLFPDEVDDIQYGVKFEGEDLYALHSVLSNLAEKLLDLQVESATISNPQK